MAEIDTSSSGGKDGKVRSKKQSTKVDLTAMVDLAFLLITFFMLTTSLNKPKAMELNMPKKTENEEDQQKIKESAVLNILLDKDNVVWYYDGLTVAGMKKTSFSGDEGIRKVVLKKQKSVARTLGDREKTIVLIKMMPTDKMAGKEGAKYKNMIDILDEMAITDTKIYAIQDISPIEIEAVENGGQVKEFAKED